MRDEDGDVQLVELLDSSFGAGPDGLPTPAERLTAGRQALRSRHHAGIAGAVLAVVAAVGVGVTVSGSLGGDSDTDGPTPPLATSGTTATPSTPAPPSTTDQQAALDRLKRKAQQQAQLVEQRLVSNQFPASFGPRGQLVVKDGWRITQRVEEPVGLQPPEASLGVVVTDGRQTRWMLLMLTRETDGHGNPIDDLGASASADDPGKAYSRFEDWLASQVALQDGVHPDASDALLVVDDTDVLRPSPGAELREVRAMPVVDGYTTSGDRMAEVRRDGRTWFVLVRGHGAEAEVIPVDAEVLSEPTFAAFVEHVRSQTASGEGLR
jgi:hypothetical protein